MDSARKQAFSLLRQQLQGWEHEFHHTPATWISSGCPKFDHFLPQKGFYTGQLVEWLGTRSSGAETLALLVARQAAERDAAQAIVVIDTEGDFYPPAAAAWGIDLQRLIVVRPACSGPLPVRQRLVPKLRARMQPDLLWALDQSLRCPTVSAVWARLPAIDPRDFRRLQLAAEEGNTLGLLLREPALRGQPSWSDLQLLVSARPTPKPVHCHHRGCSSSFVRRCLVQTIRSRHGVAGGSVELEIREAGGLRSESDGMKHQRRFTALPS